MHLLTAPAVALVVAVASLPTLAQSGDLRQQLLEANKLRAQVSTHMTGRRYDEAEKSLAQLEEAIQKLKEAGANAKDPAILSLERFGDNVKKQIERLKPKETPKKDDADAKMEKPSGDGISFVKDVAPILVRNCQGCHGMNNPRSGFSLATYANLMKGGERGDDIVAGKPDESLLVAMLRGDEEPRMPLRGRGLRDDLIEKVEEWVAQGAKFDGAPKFNPDTPLSQIVPTPEEELRAKVAAMSDAELLELHKAKAKEHWTAGNPAKTPESIETDHFIVMGTLPKEELEQAGKWAEESLRDLNRMFGRSPRETIWKGKLTLHLFATRHEYTEHAMVVEGREVPREVNGHYYTMIETSYAAVPKPSDDAYVSVKGLLIEQIAVAYLSAMGETPSWFNVGVGRYLAAKEDGRAEFYREQRQEIREQATEGDAAGAIVSQAGDMELLGFGLIEFLASLRHGDKGIAALAAQLRQKVAVDKALQAVYGLDRKSLAVGWSAFASKRYPGKKRV